MDLGQFLNILWLKITGLLFCMLCYVRACGPLYPRIAALILGFCVEFSGFFVYSFFLLFQFAIVNELCYWFSVPTGVCTVFTLRWHIRFAVWWLERLTVIMRCSLTVVCRCRVARRLYWHSFRTLALKITLRC